MTRVCPECASPVSTETVCPECGCPIPQLPDNAHQEEDIPATDDYNEAEPPYSPFSSTSWLFSKPWPISKYPKQGELKQSGSFLGWFLGPWHISYRGNGNKASINTLNDLLLLFNLQWKVFLFPQLWVFFKLLWWIVGLIVVVTLLPITLKVLKVDYETVNGIMNTVEPLTIIYGAILFILGIFLYFCGWAESLRRYMPPFYDTFMRICKRFALSISKSVKENNINI